MKPHLSLVSKSKTYMVSAALTPQSIFSRVSCEVEANTPAGAIFQYQKRILQDPHYQRYKAKISPHHPITVEEIRS